MGEAIWAKQVLTTTMTVDVAELLVKHNRADLAHDLMLDMPRGVAKKQARDAAVPPPVPFVTDDGVRVRR